MLGQKKLEDVVDLSYTFLGSPDPAVPSSECGGNLLHKENTSVTVELPSNKDNLKL